MDDYDTMQWYLVFTIAIMGAVVAAPVSSEAIFLFRNNPQRAPTQDESENVKKIMEESNQRFFETENLLDCIRNLLIKLEKVIKEKLDDETLNKYKKAVKNFAKVQEEQNKLKQENKESKRIVDATPLETTLQS
ncbi:hypothetical protein BDD12DRAFT_802552 [Trichophaea hybrida]|nr:hypothetical protein BDD12DRAFT_802552 [Trichophaea hybrida]